MTEIFERGVKSKMELLQLQYFREVARLENISKAAAHLFISQPSLSRTINNLEESLGVPLFDRKKGKISLNAYGKAFIRHVETVLMELDQGIGELKHMQESRKNLINVASSHGNSLLAALAAQYALMHEDIQIRQMVLNCGEIAEHLIDGKLDFAIATGLFEDERLEWVPIHFQNLVVLCSKTHWLAARDVVSLSELRDEQFFISYGGNSDFSQTIREYCKQAGFEPNIVLEVFSPIPDESIFVGSRFISFIPEEGSGKLYKSEFGGKLHICRLEEPLKLTLGVVKLAGTELSKPAANFLDITKKCLESGADIERFPAFFKKYNNR